MIETIFLLTFLTLFLAGLLAVHLVLKVVGFLWNLGVKK